MRSLVMTCVPLRKALQRFEEKFSTTLTLNGSVTEAAADTLTLKVDTALVFPLGLQLGKLRRPLKVQLPTKLNGEERQLLEQLAGHHTARGHKHPHKSGLFGGLFG